MSDNMTTWVEAAAAFHAHLDFCQQCEQHPFDLCTVGARLLRLAAEMAETPAPAPSNGPGDTPSEARRKGLV